MVAVLQLLMLANRFVLGLGNGEPPPSPRIGPQMTTHPGANEIINPDKNGTSTDPPRAQTKKSVFFTG